MALVRLSASVSLNNPRRPDIEAVEVDALADAGALHLCIPSELQAQLGLQGIAKRYVTLADGGKAEVPYVGPVELRFKNRIGFAGALVIGPRVVLGTIPMQDMDLVIFPNKTLDVNPQSPNLGSTIVKNTMAKIWLSNIDEPRAGEAYWRLVQPFWNSISIYDGPEVFLRQLEMVEPAIGHLFAGHWCQCEVCNGGFHQFFSNSTGVLAPEARAAFKIMGLEEWSKILHEAMKFFGDPYIRERADRQKLLAAVAREGCKRQEWDPFRHLDDQFYHWLHAEPDRWVRAADTYAEKAINY
jgi:clan AA aspartic protease